MRWTGALDRGGGKIHCWGSCGGGNGHIDLFVTTEPARGGTGGGCISGGDDWNRRGGGFVETAPPTRGLAGGRSRPRSG